MIPSLKIFNYMFRFNFVRSISTEPGLSHLAISETLGDFVVASNSPDGGVTMTGYTINGERFGSFDHPDINVTAIAYSNAPEGKNVNVIAVCFSNGSVR